MKKFSFKRTIAPFAVAVLSIVMFLSSACSPSCGLYFSTMDWACALIEAYYYEDVSEADVRAAGLENLCGNVLDIYSTYYTAEEYKAVESSNEGNRSGVGISYQYIPESAGYEGGSGVYVVQVLGNSPAEKSGLRPGTFIISAEAADGTTAQINSRDDLTGFIDARADGEQFTLITDRGSFSMAKEEYIMSYCRMATSTAEWTISYSPSGTMSVNYEESDRYSYIPEHTAYISLSQFYGNAAGEMAELIRIFNQLGCNALMLDLRNNGGGYVSVMQQLSHIFMAEAESASDIAMTARFKDGSSTEYEVDAFTSDEECYLPAGTRVAVLANNGTASASEALMGVLLSDNVAVYDDVYLSSFSDEYLAYSGTADKNARTYGKGIMQSTFIYPFTGEALKLTVAKIYWPNGRCIHDEGISYASALGCNISPAQWSVTYGDEELQSVCAAFGAKL